MTTKIASEQKPVGYFMETEPFTWQQCWPSDEGGRPLFTSPPNTADIEQRVATAIATTLHQVRANDGDGQHVQWYGGIDLCVEAVESGRWREYL